MTMGDGRLQQRLFSPLNNDDNLNPFTSDKEQIMSRLLKDKFCWRASWRRALSASFFVLLGFGVSGAVWAKPANIQDEISGLFVVDCLLPGQLRKLGRTTYMTARRPIKTTAADCNIRGGEYTAFDRANYKTALKIWMPAAEQGDADAQVNVGEIFEKGLGGAPNYKAAAIWYQRAADQGNKRGQFNIGTLYEQGLGVPKDQVKSLNWYRKAWGLPEDSVMFQSVANEQQDELRAQLEQELSEKNGQLQLLQKQIDGLELKNSTLDKQKSLNATQKSELALLKSLVKGLQQSQVTAKTKLEGLVLRTPVAVSNYKDSTLEVTKTGSAEDISYSDMKFGKYYALIIGNQEYSQLNDLTTVKNDVRVMADLLEKRYGFEVQLLINSDRLNVMRAVNELSERLEEDDNLLIYYAGHGNRITTGEREAGYWLPVNASPPPDDSSWVPNEFVTNHLARLKAKRVLVISDSCYAGLLSSSPGYLFFNKNDAQQTKEYIKYKLPRRSRLLMSSGGDKPVIDNGGNGHSVFASALLDKLKSNDRILAAPELFRSIKDKVVEESNRYEFLQEPVYKSIKGAGHEIGDFFFVPKGST